MQYIKSILALIISAAIFISCGGDSKKEASGEKAQQPSGENSPKGTGIASKLEGAWEIKRAEGMMSETNVGTVYEFQGNKLSFGKGDYKNPGTTVVTDSTFSFQADGNELVFMYDYHFNGDTLVVEMQKSGGQIFHMIKK